MANKCASVSLGPFGRNVAQEYEPGKPKITKDGVTIIKNVYMNTREAELGANQIRKVSHSTNQLCGDGTTTVAMLSSSIFEKGEKMIQMGINPIKLKRGLEKARNAIFDFLEEIKLPIKEEKEIQAVSQVCTNYDDDLAKLLTEAMVKVGHMGQTHIEPGNTGSTDQLQIEGGYFSRGYVHEDFGNKAPDLYNKLVNPLVLLIDMNDLNLRTITKVLDKQKSFQEPVLLICSNMEDNALSQIRYNYNKGLIDICVVTIPGQPEFISTILQDFSHLFDARVFEWVDIHNLENQDYFDLGKAKSAMTSAQECFIVSVEKKNLVHKAKLENRVQEVETELLTSSGNKKLLLEERLSRLGGNIALFRLGGNTKIEQQEIKDKLVDGLNSIKSSMKYGVVPGGGSALIHASKILEFLKLDDFDEQAGVTLLKEVCQEPTKWVCNNAGDNGGYIVHKQLEEDDCWNGYCLRQKKIGNMWDMGVIESYSNLRNILQDAIGTGGMLLTTETLVANVKNYKPPPMSSFPKQEF